TNYTRQDNTMAVTGRVRELWRFPVKSMQGEQLSATTVTGFGLPGDRAYGVLDVATGRIASAKLVRQFPDLMRCRAEFVAAPRRGQEAPDVVIYLPDGNSVCSDDTAVDRTLSACFGRDVQLLRAAPGIATDNQYGQVADVSADTAAPGTGAFRDAFPTSLLTAATLA